MTKKISRRYLPLGSISSGTLREEDLIPAFIGALRPLALTLKDRMRLRRLIHEWNIIEEEKEEHDREDPEKVESHDRAMEFLARNDAMDRLMEELQDLLQDYTPPFTYFGSNQGDGADFGVWLDQDSIDGGGNGDITRIKDSAELKAVARDYPDYEFAVLVNDHGNMTLYRRAGQSRRWVEVWSVV